jgi:hypothetical protein
LKGHLEVTASDGEMRMFGPGDSVLMEDVVGKGHHSRVKGADDCEAAIIPIVEPISDRAHSAPHI